MELKVTFSSDDYGESDCDYHMLAGEDLEVGKVYEKTMDYKINIYDSPMNHLSVTHLSYMPMNEPFMVIELSPNARAFKCIGMKQQFMGYAWFNKGLRQFTEVKEE